MTQVHYTCQPCRLHLPVAYAHAMTPTRDAQSDPIERNAPTVDEVMALMPAAQAEPVIEISREQAATVRKLLRG
ncbi:hypothetical protein NSZ01_05170 [Nocardioides szechwanensis]|uniref:Uncharacterized protein n=2 Tax=Nocardioides szechwanensis TaxID=1005944 RepID=A0A1G9W4C6_9ACTN|nr:hypothetical protein NSZ01_05170 [Nocardioides szechwanensis]SDM79412.1 hypothetical protein SAMN05192576_0945 [Nocardioides szechwanensis]